MDADTFAIGQRIEITHGQWAECEGVITARLLWGEKLIACDVRLDGMTHAYQFDVAVLRPLDLLAPAGGAQLL